MKIIFPKFLKSLDESMNTSQVLGVIILRVKSLLLQIHSSKKDIFIEWKRSECCPLAQIQDKQRKTLQRLWENK